MGCAGSKDKKVNQGSTSNNTTIKQENLEKKRASTTEEIEKKPLKRSNKSEGIILG